MNTADNIVRAARAEAALKAHRAGMRHEAHTAPRDLIADLMHWCDANGRDFDHELSMATDAYGEETT